MRKSYRILRGSESNPSLSGLPKLPGALLERYKQLANTKPKKPGKEAITPGCPDLLRYHEETLDQHLQLLMDAATRILHHQTQDSLVKLISALQQEALRQ